MGDKPADTYQNSNLVTINVTAIDLSTPISMLWCHCAVRCYETATCWYYLLCVAFLHLVFFSPVCLNSIQQLALSVDITHCLVLFNMHTLSV